MFYIYISFFKSLYKFCVIHNFFIISNKEKHLRQLPKSMSNTIRIYVHVSLSTQNHTISAEYNAQPSKVIFKGIRKNEKKIWKTQQWPQDWKRSVFQSQRKSMPKNVQITVQLQLFHMLARLCSKSFKTGFNVTWT